MLILAPWSHSVQAIPTGPYPYDIAVNHRLEEAYVGDQGGLTVIDTRVGSSVATIPLPAPPYGIAVNEKTGRIYVAHATSGAVSVVDAVARTVIASIDVGDTPFDVAVDAQRNLIYVTNGGLARSLIRIDGLTHRITGTVRHPCSPGRSSEPQGVAVAAAANRVYVADYGLSVLGVWVVDGRPFQFRQFILIAQRPWGIALNPQTQRLVTTNPWEQSVSLIDTGTHSLIKTIPFPPGTGPLGVAFAVSENLAYFAKTGTDGLALWMRQQAR